MITDEQRSKWLIYRLRLEIGSYTIFLFSLGGAPSPGNATNHNHATAVTGTTVTGSGGSNFKRQNTVDAATIKENSARVSASRPSAPKNSQPPGQLDTSEFIWFILNNSRDELSEDGSCYDYYYYLPVMPCFLRNASAKTFLWHEIAFWIQFATVPLSISLSELWLIYDWLFIT